MLKDMNTAIKSQREILPKAQYSNQEKLQKSIDAFRDAVNKVIEEVSKLEGQIARLPPSFSRVIKGTKELEMIKDWLSPDPSSVSFNLLIRGTRDGFDAVIFHQKCDYIKNTCLGVVTNISS